MSGTMPTRALLIAAITLLVAPATSRAITPQLPGEAQGVRIVRSGDRAAIVFTRRASGLWRRIAGKPIETSCTQLTPSTSAGILGEGTGGRAFRAPRSRRPLPIGMTPASDYCAVSLRYERDRLLTFDTVVVIPVTQAGAVALDEREKSSELIGLLALASGVGDEARPAVFASPKQMTRGVAARVLRQERLKVVPLSAATDTPPAGVIGYWSDGAQRAASVTLSSAGRRLYVELGPGEELRTNIARSIFRVDD